MDFDIQKQPILNRIKTHYGLKTNKDLAEFLEIAPQTLSSWLARNSMDHDRIYAKCKDMDLEYLIRGKGEPGKAKSAAALLATKGIPLIPVSAVAGFGSSDSQVAATQIEAQYYIPEFQAKGAQFLIRTSGSSMYPKYSNGDVLACRPIKDQTFFQWGKVYVLDTEQGPLVKRVFPCEEDDSCLVCHSDNKEHYPPFRIARQSIRSVAIVLGVVRLE